MRNTAIGYPSGRCSSGMVSKFMPWMVPIRVRREQDGRPRGDPFDLLVLRQTGHGQRPHLLVLPLPDQRGGHRQRVLQQLPERIPRSTTRATWSATSRRSRRNSTSPRYLSNPRSNAAQHVRQRVGGPLELDDLPGMVITKLTPTNRCSSPHATRSTSSRYRAGSNTTNRVGPYRSNSGPLMRRNRVLHRQLVQLELGGHRPDLRHVGPVQPDPGQPVAVPQHLVGFLQTARIGGAVPLTYTALSISVTAVPRFPNPSTLGAQRAVCVAAAGRSAVGPITP